MPRQSLIERIEDRCGDSDAQSIINIFEGLKQNLPESGQYRKGHESDTVFFNKLSLVARISYAENFPTSYQLRHHNDPLIAQPLRQTEDFNKCSFELLPAVDCTEQISDEEEQKLVNTLKTRKIDFWDTKKEKHNTGRIHIIDGNDQSFSIHIVTDRGGSKTLSDKEYDMLNNKYNTHNNIPYDIQDTFFKRHKNTLSEAWTKNEKAPDPSKIDAFLELCQADTSLPKGHKDKRLFSDGWGMHTVNIIAHKYEHNII